VPAKSPQNASEVGISETERARARKNGTAIPAMPSKISTLDATTIIHPARASTRRTVVAPSTPNATVSSHPRIIGTPGSQNHSIPSDIRGAYAVVDSRIPRPAVARTDDRTLLVLEAHRWTEQGLHAEGDLARIAPFEAIELDVGRLFPPAPTP